MEKVCLLRRSNCLRDCGMEDEGRGHHATSTDRRIIRGLRVSVGTVVGLLATGHSREDILEEYPYLEKEDIQAALAYAAWRSEEVEVPLSNP